jgi:LCP family protein required for cell wall assembly
LKPCRRIRARWIVAALLAAWASALAVAAGAAAYRLQQRFGVESAPRQLRRYLAKVPLAGEAEGRVNILLLGIPGAGYNGMRNTDTILLLSIFTELRRAALLSVPRDIAIEFPDGSLRKINEAYGFSDQTGRRGGPASLQILQDLLGVPVPYYAVIDIAGLKRMIDGVGGVWVWVDRAFRDLAFEKAKNPYAFFDAGWSRMNGERALVYARARRGTNGEGTDFARAIRQQKILVALRERASSLRVRLNPLAIWRFVNALAPAVETNLQPWQMAALRRQLAGIEVERMPPSVFTDVLDAAYDGDGIFRLHPRGGSLEQIHHRVANLLDRPSLAERLEATTRDCDESMLGRLDTAAPIPVPRWVWDLAGPIVDSETSQEVRGIVIHHDAVRHDPQRSGEEKASELRQSVLRNDGWTDLPYHYLVDVDGRVFEGAAETVATRTRTWHDASNLLHIALLGDYSIDRPTDIQIESLLRLVAAKAEEYRIPASHIHLHGDLLDTSCPGDFVRERLQPAPWCAPRLPSTAQAGDAPQPGSASVARRIEPKIE